MDNDKLKVLIFQLKAESENIQAAISALERLMAARGISRAESSKSLAKQVQFTANPAYADTAGEVRRAARA